MIVMLAHRTAHLMTVGLALSFVDCDRPTIEQLADPPELRALEVLATIRGEGFRPSGLAQTEGCKVWAVGGAWGLIVEVDLRTGGHRPIGQVPTQVQGSRIDPGPDGSLLVSSPSNTLIGLVDHRTATFRSFKLPPHPWHPGVGSFVGPAVAFESGTIAMAPIGDKPILKSPRPWLDVPLVWLLDNDGGARSIGEVPDLGGEYLSAAQSQVRVGRSGDTLHVVQLSDGTVKTFPELVTKNDNRFYTIELPQYFRAPQAWEDVWDADWLINGAHPRVYNVPQLADAVFSSDGRLIVIRNGTATWSNKDNALARTLFERPGGWKISSQWLEIYSTNGMLIGAHALPEPAPHVISASKMGLLFLLGADGVVSVVADPTSSGPCRTLPRTIDIPYVDSPYQEPLVSAAF